MRNQPSISQKQQGIALMTALLVMAIAVMVASSLIATQHYDIRIVSNAQSLERAYQYVTGIEDTAILWLKRDAEDNANDSPNDLWAYPIPPLPVSEEGVTIGMVEGEIIDLNSRLNINNLLNEDGSANTQVLTHLKTLLNGHGVPNSFAETALDWIDADHNTTSTESAENDYYLTGEFPHLAANVPLVDTHELYLMKVSNIFDHEKKYKMLQPLLKDVSALPSFTKVNINTAKESVLTAIGFDAGTVDEIINSRTDSPYETNDLQALRQRIKQQTQNNNTQNNTQTQNTDEKDSLWDYVDVTSNYFELRGAVNIDKTQLYFTSLLERNGDGFSRVIRRKFEYADQRDNQDTTSTEVDNGTP